MKVKEDATLASQLGRFHVAREPFAQEEPRAVHPGLHRSDRDVEDLRDLLVRHVVQIREDEGNPELLRNLPEGDDGIVRPGRLFRMVGNGGSQLGFRQILVPREPEQRLPAALPGQVVAGIDGDAVHPRRERRVASELPELREDGKERVLDGVGGVLGIPSTRRQRL